MQAVIKQVCNVSVYTPQVRLNGIPLVLHEVARDGNNGTFTVEIPDVVSLDENHGITIDGFGQTGLLREWGKGWLCASLKSTGLHSQGRTKMANVVRSTSWTSRALLCRALAWTHQGLDAKNVSRPR